MRTETESPAHPGQPNRAKRLATIPQAATQYPFTAAALRDLKFRAFDRTNSRGEVIKGNGTGPAGVWIQLGRKVLLDCDRFDAFLDSHRGAQ